MIGSGHPAVIDKPPVRTVPDRITVVETVYHQAEGDQPTAIESRFSRRLQTKEQPCVRKLVAGPEWHLVDRESMDRPGCWLERVGMLVIRNEEGEFTQVVPTSQERAEVAARVLSLGVGVSISADEHIVMPFARILPGKESCRFQPTDISNLWIRCQAGKAKYTVTMLPA